MAAQRRQVDNITLHLGFLIVQNGDIDEKGVNTRGAGMERGKCDRGTRERKPH